MRTSPSHPTSGTHPDRQLHQRQRRVVVWGCKEHHTPTRQECQGCADQDELFSRADAASSVRKRSHDDHSSGAQHDH
jgi:hypothetical protein